MSVTSIPRKTADCGHDDQHRPLKIVVSDAAVESRRMKLEMKKQIETKHPKRTSRRMTPFSMGETRPERAPLERGLKGQALIIQNDVQRVVNALTALSRNGDIDQAQSSAADRWYRDYVMGVVGARDPEAGRSGKAPDIHASMLARTAAVGRCRLVRAGLGLCGEIRLRLLLIEELPFSAIATKLLPNDINGRKKIAAQVVLLLEQLSELYEGFDCRSR